jgi:hypothetical protein
LDLDDGRLGLLYAQPAVPADGLLAEAGCGEVHWPPCCGDQVATQWMPLESARLTPQGFRPSAEAAGEVARQAIAARAANERAAHRSRLAVHRPAPPATLSAATVPVAEPYPCQPPQPHHAHRYDARPPWSEPETWLYWCDDCGRSGITGAELDASPINHIVPTVEPFARPGQQLIRYVPHGGLSAPPEPSLRQEDPTGSHAR